MSRTKKISLKDWEIAIRKARQYIASYDQARWKVVELAKSVCDLNPGGRKADTFSLKKFAHAIGLNQKTLYEWVRIKRNVVDKLPKTMIEKNIFKYTELESICNKVAPTAENKEVLRAAERHLKTPNIDRKFVKYSMALSSLIYNAKMSTRLANVDYNLIMELIGKCELLSDYLKKELDLRVSLNNNDRHQQTENRINEAVKNAAKLL